MVEKGQNHVHVVIECHLMLSEATLRKEGVLVRDIFDEGEGGGGCGWSPIDLNY